MPDFGDNSTVKTTKTLWLVVASIVLIALIVAVALVLFNKQKSSNSDKNLYMNKASGFSIRIPDGWHLAQKYMKVWNVGQSDPNYSLDRAPYIAFTQATQEEESTFLSHTASLVGNYDFAPGRTVFILARPNTFDDMQALYDLAAKSYPLTIQDITTTTGQSSFYISGKLNGGGSNESIVISCSAFRRSATVDPIKTLELKMKTLGPSVRSLLLQIADGVSC